LGLNVHVESRVDAADLPRPSTNDRNRSTGIDADR